jgi:hypothetical protein
VINLKILPSGIALSYADNAELFHFNIKNCQQFALTKYYVIFYKHFFLNYLKNCQFLLPLALTYFDVRLGDQSIQTIQWKDIEVVQNGKVPIVANGHANIGNEECSNLKEEEREEEMAECVNNFLAKFPMMKHFFLF